MYKYFYLLYSLVSGYIMIYLIIIQIASDLLSLRNDNREWVFGLVLKMLAKGPGAIA